LIIIGKGDWENLGSTFIKAVFDWFCVDVEYMDSAVIPGWGQ
jgi:hypothetical protein